MLSIYDFRPYREYLVTWIEAQKTPGLKGRMARALGVSSSLVSQVLAGAKSFTADQTSELADFLGLTENETDYLHLLVEYDRAGTHKYREKLERKIKALQDQSRKIGKRVPRHKELSDEQKAVYYSSWLFTGVRNLTAVPGFDDVPSLAKHLGVEPAVVTRIVRFLLTNGLCREENGRLTYGPASLHVDRESPFVNKHHQNWRVQALQKMESGRDDDLFFTSPMSLSRDAAEEIRRLLPTFIQSVMKIAGPSDSETAACLNIDWFSY